MEKKDIVVACLEWISERAAVGAATTGTQLQNYLIENGKVDPKQTELLVAIGQLHKEITNSGYLEQPGYMRFESHMALVDYQELQHAIKESKEARLDARNAMRVAKWSLWVSGGLALIQIVLGVIALVKGP